ncbi:MAG: helix-turn-helix domain-containing protein [Bacteroidota bacterium]|jgi:excisionase family DNA binding protein
MNQIVVIRKEDLSEIMEDLVTRNASAHVDEERANRFLDVQEAAAYLKLARQTIYGLTSKRNIPFFKKGKKLYFRESDLKDWLLSGKKVTSDEIREKGLNSLKERTQKP